MDVVLITEQLAAGFRECIPAEMLDKAVSPETLSLGAVDSGTHLPLGTLMATASGSSLCIDWLYVLPGCRGRGAASMLLGQLAIAVAESPYLRQIVAAYPKSAENQYLSDFFASRGFSVNEQEGRCYSFTIEQLATSGFWQGELKRGRAAALEDTSDGMLKDLGRELRDRGVSAIPIPIVRSAYDRKLSTFSISGGKITSALLVSKTFFGYELAFLYSMHGGDELKYLIKNVGRLAINSLPPETLISLAALDESAKSLFLGLIPEAKPITEVYATVSVIHEGRA